MKKVNHLLHMGHFLLLEPLNMVHFTQGELLPGVTFILLPGYLT